MKVEYNNFGEIEVPYMGTMVLPGGGVEYRAGIFTQREFEELFSDLSFDQALEKMSHSENWVRALRELKQNGTIK